MGHIDMGQWEMAEIVKIYATDTASPVKSSSGSQTKGKTADVVIFPGGQPLNSIKPSGIKSDT